MDGLVLVLAIILNPRSKAAQRIEQMSREGASDDGEVVETMAVVRPE